MTRVTAPAVTEADAAGLARYLLSFRWPLRDAAVAAHLVAIGLPLWRHVLRFVPECAPGGRALELGSPPFHITLLLQRLRRYELSLAGFPTGAAAEARYALESAEYGERHVLTCACFDVEHDRFPHPDASFDLVLCCELIEHLTENPVHMLSEIHRVLRPGGSLVVSTPNVTRAGNLGRMLRGENVYDPYHLGSPLRGTRHSREYTQRELHELLVGCGFRVAQAEAVDVEPSRGLRQRALRLLLHRVVAPLTGACHRSHLFVRAVRTEAPFRWHFPPTTFDPAHAALHLDPRATRVIMGENDAIHTTGGWSPLALAAGGRPARRCGDSGDVYLRADGALARVTAAVSAGSGEVQLWRDGPGAPVMLGGRRFEAPPDEWIDVVVGVGPDYRPGGVLHVRFDTPGGVDVHAVVAD